MFFLFDKFKLRGMNNTMNFTVESLLIKLQNLYRDRPVDEADLYLKSILRDHHETSIIGTSENEWCLGVNESKDLLINDLKYWGPVKIDTENATINMHNEVSWFYASGSVEYDFKKSNDTYSSFLEDVCSYIKEKTCWLGDISDEEKLTVMAYELGHFLAGNGEKYRWKFILSGVAILENSKWLFSHLLFSLPVTNMHPDERILQGNCYEKSHQATSKKIGLYARNQLVQNNPELNSMITKFLSTLSSNLYSTHEYNKSPIIFNECSNFIDIDHKVYHGEKHILDALELFNDRWGQAQIKEDDLIIFEHNDTCWFLAHVYATIKKTREKAAREEICRLDGILDAELNARDKLHRIYSQILSCLNEIAQGEEYCRPLRIQGLICKENGSLILRHLMYSFPTNIILEGKTDAVELV